METSAPIRKHQISIVEAAGWTVPESHTAVGLFYCYNGNVYCSGSFGSNIFKITVRGGVELTELEEVLERAVAS
jgi:hypothetical protein